MSLQASNANPPAAAGPSALDRRLAAPMFVLTILFLLVAAGALHFGAEKAPVDDEHAELPAGWCVFGLALLYPLYWLEACLHLRAGTTRRRQFLSCGLLPPLRLGVRDHNDGRSIWLPGIGWGVVDDDLRRRVERGAHRPMLIVALFVLPLLAAQHYLSEHVHHSLWLQMAVEAGAGLIWMAFTIEFIVMFSIAPKRWTYARQHWLDLIIICFPLIAFLRLARASAVLRAMRVTRLQQLTKVFRLRGTFMRLWRAVLLLGLLERVFRGPEARLAGLRDRVAAREHEIAELKREIAQLEEQLAAAPRPPIERAATGPVADEAVARTS
jgi:voltage-gated potassium channel